MFLAVAAVASAVVIRLAADWMRELAERHARLLQALLADAGRAALDALTALRLADSWRDCGPPVIGEQLALCCVGVPGPPAETRRIVSRPEALLNRP